MRLGVVIREAIGNMFLWGVVVLLFIKYAMVPCFTAMGWLLDFLQ